MKWLRSLRFLIGWYRDESVWDGVAALVPVVGGFDWHRHEREMRRGEHRS